VISVGVPTPILFAFTSWRLRHLQISTTLATPPAFHPVRVTRWPLIPLSRRPESTDLLPSRDPDGPLFVTFLLAVVVVVTLLQFLPALALGPIAEHFLAGQGATF